MDRYIPKEINMYNKTIKNRREFLNKKLSKGHPVGITWIAKVKGESTACISLKNYESKGKCTVAHKPELYNVWCRNRKRFANINLGTIKEVRADKKVYRFK